ncbi:flavodoxin-like protein [Leptotrichia wadei]|jgi:NAD(P)H dehydrogenase (quinone)|uniref:Flavodoxin-like protein n=1 Tax=Leptotrichia wadei TaxID=157687 RepID=A0A510KQT3_9FUSO|nr:NAD(P)H-dependent oxidoreductase [Leptotrichia wadei]BBM54110.1 flavodoxin-like protein [Leptotrichia wadei]
MKTLVILAHPDMENSRINKRWKEELEKYPDKITVNELYKNYPNWDIDIEREHELLLSHDNIIIQFPLYWYTYTPLLKKWLDDVLSYNWAYGNEYNLKGKNIGVAISIGGFESDYSKTGSVKFSMDEILIHFKATVEYVKANLISHYFLFDTDNISDEELSENAGNYIKYIFNINWE